MRHIILIGGFGGSGKTTVSQMLASKLSPSALIETDHLFMINPMEDWDLVGRLKTKNVHALTKTFLEEKFTYVICSGYVWSQKELDGVVEEFADETTKVWLFWLETSKEVRHARAKAREADGADTTPFLEMVEEKFVKHVSLPLLNKGAEWREIRTENKTPQQVTEEIVKMLTGDGAAI